MTDPSEADYWRRVDDFAGALQRLIDLTAVFVAIADGSTIPRAPLSYPPLGRVIRAAFERADEARAGVDRAGPAPPRRGFPDGTGPGGPGEPPARFAAPQGAFLLYGDALGPAWDRWGCPGAFFRRGDAAWFGRLYPEDFPARGHLIYPGEVDRLRAALALARFRYQEPPPPADVAGPGQWVEGSKARLLAALGLSVNYTRVLPELAAEGKIHLERREHPDGPARRPTWRMFVLDPGARRAALEADARYREADP